VGGLPAVSGLAGVVRRIWGTSHPEKGRAEPCENTFDAINFHTASEKFMLLVMSQLRHLGRLAAALSVASTAPVALVLAAACASPLELPAALGRCDAQANMTCPVPVITGGGGGGPASPSPEEASVATVGDETTSLGVADTELARVGSNCQGCVVESCPNEDVACSNDAYCPAMLSCVASGAASDSCALLYPADSVTLYDDLAVCVKQGCPTPQCPLLALPDGG